MRRAQAADDGDVCQLHRHLISAKSAAHAAAAAGPGQRARRLPSFLFLPAQPPLAGAEAGADVLDEPLAAPDDAVWFCMRLSSSDAVSKALAICGSLSTV